MAALGRYGKIFITVRTRRSALRSIPDIRPRTRPVDLGATGLRVRSTHRLAARIVDRPSSLRGDGRARACGRHARPASTSAGASHPRNAGKHPHGDAHPLRLPVGRRARDASSLTLAKHPHPGLPWPRSDPRSPQLPVGPGKSRRATVLPTARRERWDLLSLCECAARIASRPRKSDHPKIVRTCNRHPSF